MNADDICERFESGWTSSDRRSMRAFLTKGSDDETLFRRLLALDVGLRQRAGELVLASDYHAEFPQFQAIIDEVLHQTLLAATLSQGDSDTRTRSTTIPDEPPSRIGDYELKGLLGRGGMGEVYKARQVSLNRLVALKMIRSGDRAGPDEMRRFRAEAEAAAKLDHPGIVPVYEVGEAAGRLYFSMGLVEGSSLDVRIARQPPTTDEAVRIVEQAARAVAYAHSRGVIHRDLKPGNIMIDAAGAPHITDFGLAKMLNGDQDLTTTGQVLGTPSYMPPEQAQGDGDAIGPASDVYSLGAVLYRLLTGRVPFQAATLIDTLHEVVHADPLAPSTLVRGLSPDLNTICLKCLEKGPTRRYATATELADELARFLRREPILARPVSTVERAWRWCQRNRLVAALALLIVVSLLTGTIVSTYFGYSATINATAAKAAALDASAKLGQANAARAAEKEALALAQSEAYISNIALSYREWLDRRPGSARERLAATTTHLRGWEYGLLESMYGAYQSRLVTDDPSVTAACFASDSSQVLSGGQGTLRLWDVATRRVIKSIENLRGGYVLAVTEVPVLAAWAVVMSNGKLLIIDPRTSNIVAEHDLGLVKQPNDSLPPRLISATFSHDGRLMLATQDRQTPLYLWNVIAGQALPSPDQGDIKVDYITLSPDGFRYAIADQNHRVGIGVVGEESKLVWQKDDLVTARIHGLAFVAEPGELFVAGPRSHYLNADTKQVTELNDTSASVFTVHWDTLAAVDYQGRLIYGAPLSQRQDELRGSEGEIHLLRFSLDGRRLLSVGKNHAGKRELIIWDLEQFKQRQSQYPIFPYGWLCAISPDQSRAVLRWPEDDKKYEVRFIDTATGKLVRNVNLGTNASQAEFSADGAWLAITTLDDKQKMWGGCLKVADGDYQPLPDSDQQNAFAVSISAEGKYVAAIVQAWGEFGRRLCVWRRSDNKLLLQAAYNLQQEQAFAFSSDGQRLAYNEGGEVLVVELASQKVLRRFALPDDKGLKLLQFSPSDRQLAGGGFSAGYVWKLDSDAAPIRLRGHHGLLGEAAFTRNETRLLTTAQDGTIKVWELPSGREILSIPSQGDVYFQLSLSPDDSRLVTVSLQNVIAVRQWLTTPNSTRLKLPPP